MLERTVRFLRVTTLMVGIYKCFEPFNDLHYPPLLPEIVYNAQLRD